MSAVPGFLGVVRADLVSLQLPVQIPEIGVVQVPHQMHKVSEDMGHLHETNKSTRINR